MPSKRPACLWCPDRSRAERSRVRRGQTASARARVTAMQRRCGPNSGHLAAGVHRRLHCSRQLGPRGGCLRRATGPAGPRLRGRSAGVYQQASLPPGGAAQGLLLRQYEPHPVEPSGSPDWQSRLAVPIGSPGQPLSLLAGIVAAGGVMAASGFCTRSVFHWGYPAACTILATSDITASVCCLSAEGGGDVAAVATASFSPGASSANCPP